MFKAITPATPRQTNMLSTRFLHTSNHTLKHHNTNRQTVYSAKKYAQDQTQTSKMGKEEKVIFVFFSSLFCIIVRQ